MRLADILGLGTAVLLAACQPSFELTNQQRNIQQSIIEDQIDEWTQALNNRELDVVMAMYDSSDALVAGWPNGIRATGREASDEALNGFYNDIQYMNFGHQNLNVEVVNPGAAVATFRFSVDIVYNDTRRDPFAGQGTMVWVRASDEDTWKILVQQLSRNP